MPKETDRAALQALLMESQTVATKCPTVEQDVALSASFRQHGIAKKGQRLPLKALRSPANKRKAKPVKRNYEAQRRYDEIHGTDNGYDPSIRDWQEMHDHEMDS